jgi:general secretion pathway protein B
MSYILEALKKAQAERQLGSTPSVHAPTLVRPAPAAAPASRKPLLIGLGAGAVLATLAGALAWRQLDRAPPAPPVTAAAAVPPAAPLAVAAVPVTPPAPAAAPVKESPAPVRHPVQAKATHRADAAEARAATAAPAAAASPTAQPDSEAQAAPPVVAESAPDNVRSLQELPESIRREVPKVAIGGYIYSKNPADRLLLVDKMLRREGEQLAPGLVLEKLLPKAAVMNYKGYRYRVAY